LYSLALLAVTTLLGLGLAGGLPLWLG